MVSSRISVTIYDTLAKVEGIRKGKDVRLRETAPVRPVPDEHFWPVVKEALPQIATMLQVQRLAGMRPDEVTIMRPCDIEQAGDLWVYRPDSHKLDWRGIDKEILLGPQAQALLQSWTDRPQVAYLFSPKEATEASLAKRRKPDAPKRHRKRRKSSGRSRKPREHYTDDTYRRSVQRICQQVGVPMWSPGRLRHNAGTKVRHTFGVEAAQLVLGHRKLSTTEIYAEKNREEYGRIMMEIG